MEQEERIRARAYRIWEHEGRPFGREHEHWQRAVHEIGEEGTIETAAVRVTLPETTTRTSKPAGDNPGGRGSAAT